MFVRFHYLNSSNDDYGNRQVAPLKIGDIKNIYVRIFNHTNVIDYDGVILFQTQFGCQVMIWDSVRRFDLI